MSYEKMGRPISHIAFHGKCYPIWRVTRNRKTATVSSMALFDKVNCAQMVVANDPQIDAVEQKIDYYVGPDEGPDVVAELMKTGCRGIR